MEAIWRIEMLGTLRASHGETSTSKFRTRRVALLLAQLAFYRTRLHFRDEIGETLWPDSDPEAIRRNLRQALFSLRHVLEPPHLPAGSILQVQQSRLRLNPDLVTTDVVEFERAIDEARKMVSIQPLLRAVDLYKGELLPGFEDDWIVQERIRLEDLYVYALRHLIDHYRAEGNVAETVHFLELAIQHDPLGEEWRVELIQEFLGSGRPESAVQQYEDLARRLGELEYEPGEAAQELLKKAKSNPSRDVVPIARQESVSSEAVQRVVRLPVQVTRFCGRQEEINLVTTQLTRPQAQLTSLIGPAGTGKTRLSIEVGRRLAEVGDWNIWFVPLADLTDGSLILDAILETLRARRSTEQDPYQQLREALHGHDRNLIILDNLEHIVDQAAPHIADLLSRIGKVQLLVTSRQPLRLTVEHLIPVPPLAIPFARDHLPAIDQDELKRLAEFSSVQLFVDRCQAIRPDFQLTVNNSRAISSICAQLEGIPLAIELAAGLSGSFSPSQLALHLQKRLTALTSRRRDMPARHRSLRAAIDYSYETLSSELQALFAALSVFRSGFTVHAAYEVCFRDRYGAGSYDDCLEMLMELQERSLIQVDVVYEEDPDQRFRMLESFRQYAEERLAPYAQRELRARHAEYYRTHPPRPQGVPTAEERTRRHLWIAREFDNYIAALDFYLDEDQLEPAIELLGMPLATWSSRGPRMMERGYIRQIADRAAHREVEPNARILLQRMLGTTYIRSSEYAAAYRVCEVALKVAQDNNLTEQIGICHLSLATCSGYLGNLDDCLRFCQRVLEIIPESNIVLHERAHHGIGAVYWGKGMAEEAEVAFRKAAELSIITHGGEPDTLILYNLARVCLDDGRLDEALTRLGEAMRICQRLRDEFSMATCLSLVSRYHWLKGDLNSALSIGREALVKHRETDFLHWSLLGIFQQALILVDLGEWEAASILLAATQGIGKPARVPDQRDHDAAIEKLKAEFPATNFERAWARGLTMGAEEAFRLALKFK